jgi:hypothetical protein
MLHVHPLLGNVLVNKLPRRQILGKESDAGLRNNRGGCFLPCPRWRQAAVDGGHVTCVSCDACPFLGYMWQNSFGSTTSQFSVSDSYGNFIVEEEYKKLASEDLTRDLKTWCVL